ncbi:hypothetical protein BC629DRAFT_1592873 [Irpex lacteus]|nr:hypothetical protein BC629DRAFT_1592873 [Irpex lacteus]
MSRRSDRIKRLRVDDSIVSATLTGEDGSDAPELQAIGDGGNSDLEVEEQPTQKTRAKKGTRSTGRVGKLHNMLDMPLDVILEICSLLHPKDILHLARATRQLRQYFMSRRAVSVWKAALANLPGVPPCPEDLSEPAFCGLLFEQHCSCCLSRNCQDVYWQCGVRLCDSCRNRMEWHEGDTEFKIEAAAKRMLKSRQLTELVPVVRVYRGKQSRFYLPALKDLITTLKKTPSNERAAFLDRKAQLLKSRCQGLSSIHEYLDDLKCSRKDELSALRKERLDEILKRLKEAGYEEEVNDMIKSWCGLDAFKRDPVVGKAQALTPRIWKNIEGELIADMEKRRADRLASRRKTTLTHRLESLRRFVKDQAGKFPHNQLSSLEIALCIPEVYQALDPNIQEFNVEKFFLTLHALVPQFVEDREEHSRDILRSTLRKELALEESTDPFGLAVTMQLKCDRCGKSVTLDQIAQHGCTQHFPPPQHVLVAGMPVLDQEIIIHMFRWQSHAPFWISDLHCFRRSIKDAAAVVEACGFNANTTTVSSMDAAEIMLTCRNHDLYAPVMKWREAVVHAQEHTVPYKPLEQATEAEVSVAKDIKAAAAAKLQSTMQEPTFQYACGRCKSLVKSTKALSSNIFGNVTAPTETDCIESVMQSTVKVIPTDTVYLISDDEKHKSNLFTTQCLQNGTGRAFRSAQA